MVKFIIVGLILIFIVYRYIINQFKKAQKKFEEKISVQQKSSQNDIRNLNNKHESEIQEFLKINNNLKKEISILTNQITNFNNKISFLEQGIKEKDELFHDANLMKDHSIYKILSLSSDFKLAQYELSSYYLKTKNHPANLEARRISDLKVETKTYIEQYRQMVYKYESLLQLFPELSSYVDDFETIRMLEDVSSIKDLQDNYDRVKFYLTKDEWERLSVDDRNQLALDNYIKGQKSNWQIGRDYELYCGQIYENENWKVEFIGMEKKINDMGRDLIAIKGNEHHVIQCKYWSKDKLIHEKHITQLFGTTMMYAMDMPDSIIVKPIFITNINLSDSARKFADKLNVTVKENVLLKDFPRIKCNINRDEYGMQTYIYHLPFDQQYDRTRINKGDFYAYTVKEAVQAGFRRAYKFFG